MAKMSVHGNVNDEIPVCVGCSYDIGRLSLSFYIIDEHLNGTMKRTKMLTFEVYNGPWQDHTFLRRIFAAANEAGWGKKDLKKASNCIIQEFLNQNFLGVTVQSLQQWASDNSAVNVQVDARTLTSHMEDSLRLMTSIQQTQIQH